jgi:hypothetical protein
VTGQAGVALELGPEQGRRAHLARAQLGHLFPPVGIPLHLGYGPVPPGYREVESWRVIPDRRSPRFLVPADPAAAARLVLSHNALRPPRVAAMRRLAAIAMRPLARRQGEAGLLRLSVPDPVTDDDVAAAVITRHLAHRVPGARSTAVSLRDFHPRAKPTVQVAAADGTVLAFGKVAADPATGARVLAEADLLAGVGPALRAAGARVQVPTVLDAGTCGPFRFSLVAPLPASATRVGLAHDDAVCAALQGFSTAQGTRRAALGSTGLWQSIYERVEAAQEARSQRPDLVAGLSRLADAIALRDCDTSLEVGWYHGDWVPWNLARDPETGVLWTWDLEYGARSGPLGLDALRWVFQVRHVLRRASFGEAIGGMVDAGPQLLPALGIDPSLTPLLVRLHVLETMATALALLAGGRGLPGGLDADAVSVMAAWQP